MHDAGDRAAIDPSPLQAVADVVERDQFAAVECRDDRNAGAPADVGGRRPGRHRPVGVQDVDAPAARQRLDGGGKPALNAEEPQPRRPLDAPDVVDGRAAQRVDARFVIIMQREHVDVVPARQLLDQPQQARHDAFAAGAIDAAGHDQTDAHAHQHLTGR